MNEIKFRAWHLREKRYLKNFSLDYASDGGFWQAITEDRSAPDIPEKVIIEQYTGLKDIHNNEIYKNDIVEYKNKLYVVEWHKYGWFIGDWPLFNDVEKIGNIHQNPELMENNQ